nr:hypothetical protein [Tanacetum cinerariifolium]
SWTFNFTFRVDFGVKIMYYVFRNGSPSSFTSSQGYQSVSYRTRQESQELITEKDEEEEEEPNLTWYLASNPNLLKFLVLLFGVLESDYICDEFIKDYNILLVIGCAVKEEKIIPAEAKVQLPSEYDFKPVGVY